MLDVQSQTRYSASVNIVDRGYISALVFQQLFSFSRQHAKIKVYLCMHMCWRERQTIFPQLSTKLGFITLDFTFQENLNGTEWLYSYTTYS